MSHVKLYTIGFTQKSAQDFFGKLIECGIKVLIDVRLNNVSQLAGFAKRDDLAYFLKQICGCAYRHEPLLAPTRQILDNYKKGRIDWQEYESRFNELLSDRKVENIFDPKELDLSCLLCSEPEPNKCHRRLVAEYFRKKVGNLTIEHL